MDEATGEIASDPRTSTRSPSESLWPGGCVGAGAHPVTRKWACARPLAPVDILVSERQDFTTQAYEVIAAVFGARRFWVQPIVIVDNPRTVPSLFDPSTKISSTCGRWVPPLHLLPDDVRSHSDVCCKRYGERYLFPFRSTYLRL